MRVYPKSKDKKLCILCNTLTRIINSEDFEKLMIGIKSFEYDFDPDDGEVNGEEVLRAFRNCIWDARVKLYYPWWPFSRVNGYYLPDKYLDVVFINKRRFKRRSLKSSAKTILHEIVHMVDNFDQSRRYAHGDNSPFGKSESAPWKISEVIIENLYDKYEI